MTEIDELSGTGASERNELLRWFARMTDAERLDVLELQRDLLRRWRNEGQKAAPPTVLGALVLALAKRRATTEILERKPDEGGETENNASRLFRMRVDSLAKGRAEGQKSKIYRLRYHRLVCDLRKEGLGWRACSAYLAKYHRFVISHEHLKTLHVKFAAREEARP